MGNAVYDGKYSIDFKSLLLDETKNSYEDFHLAPKSRPVIDPPKQKTNYIDVPGMNGHLDASTILTGYPVFENRTGSLSFYVLTGFEDWFDVYNRALSFLHGRQVEFILDDEPQYFYTGVMEVNKWESKKDFSEITLDYDVEPYKWSVQTTTEDWLWDTFDFELGIIGTDTFRDVDINYVDYTEFEIDPYYLGDAPICPLISVSSVTSTISIKIVNSLINYTKEYELQTGDNQYPDVVLHRNDAKLYLKGTGTISMTFRKGIL